MNQLDSPKMIKILESAIKHYGDLSQINKIIEELAELIVAIQHAKVNRGSSLAVAEECADVLIMCAQLRLMVGPALVDSFIGEKVKRLEARVNNPARDL